jgi:hypothetical protein
VAILCVYPPFWRSFSPCAHLFERRLDFPHAYDPSGRKKYEEQLRVNKQTKVDICDCFTFAFNHAKMVTQQVNQNPLQIGKDDESSGHSSAKLLLNSILL